MIPINIMNTFKKMGILSSIYLTNTLFIGNIVKAQESCVVTNINKIVCGKLLPQKDSSSIRSKMPAPQPVITKGIKFDLSSCLRKGRKDVDCLIKLTNISDETILNLYAFPSTIIAITSEGMHYKAQTKVREDIWIGSPENGTNAVNLASKKSVLIKVSYIIPESINKLDSIEVGIYTRTGKIEPIQLENVFIE